MNKMKSPQAHLEVSSVWAYLQNCVRGTSM